MTNKRSLALNAYHETKEYRAKMQGQGSRYQWFWVFYKF